MEATPTQTAASGDGTQTTQMDSCNLIVNYLPQGLNEDALCAIFGPFGQLEACKLMTDKHTGQSLGYGFVKFKSPEAAHSAIGAINGLAVANKTLKVSYARPPSQHIQHTNLYVSHLPHHFTKRELDELFAPYGAIIDSKVLFDSRGESRGVGFVRYDTRQEAEHAIHALNHALLPGANDPLNVKLADGDDKRRRQGRAPSYQRNNQHLYYPVYYPPPQQPAAYANTGFAGQGEHGPQGFCLFVFNLPPDTDENLLYRLFGPYGAIASVKVIRDNHQAKCKGYGFVNFLKYEDAQNAINALNGFHLGNKFLQVSFKTDKKVA